MGLLASMQHLHCAGLLQRASKIWRHVWALLPHTVPEAAAWHYLALYMHAKACMVGMQTLQKHHCDQAESITH
jgi:hypothetical protein